MSAIVKDKATAAWNDLTGSQTNKILCKASSHEIAGPKKKHVDYLIHLTSDPACHVPNLADLLNDRLRHSKWVVVFKGLVLAHNLMTLGNEKFLQCLATRSNNFSLETFMDRSDLLAADMSIFVRKYAKYLGFMCTGYRMLALDICRLPKGEASPLKTMDPTKVLKIAGVAQQQLDLLLETEMTSGELTNGVINTGFLMLYKDVIKLYTVYNDALINLLEKFFEMKKQNCREAIDVYRKFLIRQEPVQKFLQLAEEVGVDRQSHLNLRQVPEDLLPALESHLSEMDSSKKTPGAATSTSIKAASEKLAALKTSSTTETPPPTSSSLPSFIPSASEEILEAQRKRFEELKRQSEAAKASRKNVSPSASAAKISNVIEKSPEELALEKTSSGNDLFGLKGFSSLSHPTQSTQPVQQPAPTQPNPWAPTSSLPPTQPQPQSQPQIEPTFNPFQPKTTAQPASNSTNPWEQNSGYQEVDLFTEIRGGQPDFDAVFGQHAQPQPKPPTAVAMGNGLGGMLQPMAVGVHAAQQTTMSPQPLPVGLGTTDVESSLTKAAENLTMELGRSGRTGLTKKTEHQWKPPAPSVKTGGPNWQPQQIQPKTLMPGPQAAAAKGGAPADWNRGMYGGYFPQSGAVQQPFTQQPPTQVSAWPQQPVQPQDPFGPIGAQAPQLF